MSSMSMFLRGVLLVATASASPLLERDSCNHDNLLRCFIKSSQLAGELCTSLPAFTTTVTTVTASTTTTLTTSVTASTETDIIYSTATVYTTTIPVATTTKYYPAQNQQKRGATPAIKCLSDGTTYPASRITSACACISAPAPTISVTYTVSTRVITEVSTVLLTATTSITTIDVVSTAAEAVVTKTVGCVPPAATDVMVNGGFECNEIRPWTVQHIGGDVESIVSPGLNSNYALRIDSSWYRGDGRNKPGAIVSQTLNTVAGTRYRIDFDLFINGGTGNHWSVLVNDGQPIASGDRGFVPTSFGGTFQATGSDVLKIKISTDQWAYAYYDFDNFVIAPVSP